NPAFWNQKAAKTLNATKKLQPFQTSAKDLIIFLGDGNDGKSWYRRRKVGKNVPWGSGGKSQKVKD
ncbi:hypothetical protein A6R68_13742, partial [Neotoma lepida]